MATWMSNEGLGARESISEAHMVSTVSTLSTYNLLTKDQLVTELYNPANQRDPAKINEIQARLQQLQKTEHAWVIADSLLQSEHSAQNRFMGALTFTVKINVSW